MFNLTGKVALVTGARRGMGKAHARALASQGAKVAVTDINKEECEAVVEEIKAAGGDARAWKLDVANNKEIDIVVGDVAAHFGRLDILINNAGIFEPKPALEMSEDEWEKTIHINLRGEFFCAQRAAKEMMKNKWGRIINIASVASGGVGIGFAGGAHYTASKGGIVGMTETLAIEWAPLGITVNAIAPGAIDTPMISAAGMSPEETQAMLARIPLRRFGKSEEIAAAAVFLSSDEASYVTGATLYVDGGWLAQ
ncbi:MAG: SDR family oxidoreductase [Parcubacteria group bacterium]|nr:SDR family oxidoreductase [Parcubacteria group bacterium]